MNRQHAIVTGATGILGSSLCQQLLRNGYRVTGIARRSAGNLSDETRRHPGFSLVPADLSDPGDSKFAADETDIVYHCAGVKPTMRSAQWPEFYRGNVKATAGALRVAHSSQARLFVHCSTYSIFSEAPEDGILRESTLPTPSGHYGISKYAAERLVAQSNIDAKCVVVRFPSIFGRQHATGIVPEFFQKAVAQDPISVFSEGKPRRNLLHEQDAIDMLLSLAGHLDTLPQKQTIHYGSSDSRPLIEIAHRIKQLTGSPSRIVPEPAKAGIAWDSRIDIGVACALLQLEPASIDEGLARYIEEMRDAV